MRLTKGNGFYLQVGNRFYCAVSVCPNKYKDAFISHQELLLLFGSVLSQKLTSYFSYQKQNMELLREAMFFRRLVGNLSG